MNHSKLRDWLQYTLVGTSTDKQYRLVLLEENLPQRCEIIRELKQYMHIAHEDFRRHHRELLRNPLTPFEEYIPQDPVRGYPGTLHISALKGYFGETFAAIITQYFSPFGIDNWEVPAFLFRFHEAAWHQLQILHETGDQAPPIPGRLGDDFIAFQRNSIGQIVRILYCEAKCHATHSSEEIKKAYKKAGQSVIVSLSQVIEVLEDQDGPEAVRWINAIRFAVITKQYEKCNMVSYVCGDQPCRGRRTWLPMDKPHDTYQSKNVLEAVETHLNEIDTLIREVYLTSEASDNPMQPERTQEDEALALLSKEALDSAAELRKKLAGSTFPKPFAKLYSQHTRLGANLSGLINWTETETEECLDDALRLIEVAFTERDGGTEDWQESTRRAGELLEWLSHPDLNTDRLPTRYLSAAAYQIAGYPARSTGLLNASIPEENESQILKFLLKADFPQLLGELTKYWTQILSTQGTDQHPQFQSADELSIRIHNRIVKETLGALGILCASMRWGDEPRVGRAIAKLKSVGKVLLHSDDPYSWLLARLCAEVAGVYTRTSKRQNLAPLAHIMSATGVTALERYLRQCYCNNKTLAWPSQMKGIEKLIEGNSFVLCTPTGSGKTTVAELAILQSLFSGSSEKDNNKLPGSVAPLAIYIVPSRALAAEVESALSRVLCNLNEPPITVTGLYGGTDWGPTDAWLTSGEQTVLICTPEKAEALIRFLGPSFLKRVSLLVIDEAHTVQFDSSLKDSVKSLQEADNRALRLEALCSRLFTYLDTNQKRIIALSAVANGIEKPLTGWVTGQQNAHPAKTSYRSTRQLIGRLEYLPERRFVIKYDLLDGANLQYVEGRRNEQPYIPEPIPQLPYSEDYEDGPETQLRPYLFWAAIHLASLDEVGLQHSVLISVTQQINAYVKAFLELLEKTWANIQLPMFFQPPQDEKKAALWGKCLRTCEDYFGKGSYEYRLLQRGVVVHHGRMPGLLARLLTDAVQDRIVYLVIATSTLSEGVNLPFETILIPNLMRRQERISEREFANLVGRAGRPGFGTEGRTLVLYDGSRSPRTSKYRAAYDNLVEQLQAQGQVQQNVPQARSPLAELLRHLEETYKSIPGVGESGNFQEWLEQTEPLKAKQDLDKQNGLDAIETLDTLDSLLLSCIVEVEQLVQKEELSVDLLEKRLQEVWQRSYAHYAAQEETRLQEIFLTRGRTLKERIYPNARQRKRLYHTSLPPRHGMQLLDLYPLFKQALERGREYALWEPNTRLEYIQDLVAQLTSLPKFRLDKDAIKKMSWREVLQWWLNPTSITLKTPTDVSDLYQYVSKNFGYRFNWGLGSMVALAADEVLGGDYLEPSLDNWSLLGLPWIALWLKELIIWGTLEPVGAYLLSKNLEVTREAAERAARGYYEDYSFQHNTDELLNVATIRNWAAVRYGLEQSSTLNKPPDRMKVELTQDLSKLKSQRWRVFPVQMDKKLNWFDPSGALLATSAVPLQWRQSFLDDYDFTLDIDGRAISAKAYRG